MNNRIIYLGLAFSVGLVALMVVKYVLKRREREEASRAAWNYLANPPFITCLHQRKADREGILIPPCTNDTEISRNSG